MSTWPLFNPLGERLFPPSGYENSGRKTNTNYACPVSRHNADLSEASNTPKFHVIGDRLGGPVYRLRNPSSSNAQVID